MVALGDSDEWTADKRTLLDRINDSFGAMEPADHVCFDNSVVERPAWIAVRAMAADSLRQFGWESTVVAPFEEVEPGVWRRPPAEG